MGTYITMYVEKKEDNGVWVPVAPPLWTPELEASGLKLGLDLQALPKEDEESAELSWPFVQDYQAFAVLAGVCDREGLIQTFLDEPIPADLSLQVRTALDQEEEHGVVNAPSVTRLKRLVEFDWDREVWREMKLKPLGNGMALLDGPVQKKPLGTYKQYAAELYGLMELLRGYGEPENIRVVYWFD